MIVEIKFLQILFAIMSVAFREVGNGKWKKLWRCGGLEGRSGKNMRTNLSFQYVNGGAGRKYEGAGRNTL